MKKILKAGIADKNRKKLPRYLDHAGAVGVVTLLIVVLSCTTGGVVWF
jgi:hypothetical protein